MLLEVVPREACWAAIGSAWDAFIACVRSDTPLPLNDRDKVVRTDAPWQAAAEQYARLKAEADALAVRLDEAKEALTGLASHPSASGFGVSVSCFWRQGNVDYKRVP